MNLGKKIAIFGGAATAAAAVAAHNADAGAHGVARGMSPQAREIYVSNSGSDANSGATKDLAIATLGRAVSLYSQGASIYLARGSVFREQFAVPDGAFVSIYGTGVAPIVSGADVLPNASFVLHSGNCYKISLPSIPESANQYAGLTNSDVLMVWENGVRLGGRFENNQTSIAGCVAAAGSFFWDSAAKVLYVHAADSGNPISNGKTYEASVRTLAIHGGDGFYVEGIVGEKAYAKTQSGQQGYGILGNRSGTYRNCVGRQSWNHAVGVANTEDCHDLVFDRCDALDCEVLSDVPATLFIAYRGGTKPSRVIFRDCFAKQPVKHATVMTIGFLSHGASCVAEISGSCTAVNCGYGFQIKHDESGLSDIRVPGVARAVDCKTGILVGSAILSLNAVAIRCTTIGLECRASASVRAKIIDCAIGAMVGGFQSAANAVLDVSESYIARTAQDPDWMLGWGLQGLGTSKVNIARTVFHNLGCALSYNVTTSDFNTYSNCQFIGYVEPGGHGDGTIAAWRTLSGQDANSTQAVIVPSWGDMRVSERPSAELT